MSDLEEQSGSCLCGSVRILAQSKSMRVGACHCSMCRKWTGGPLLAVECGDDVSFTGEANISTFDSSAWAVRGFCNKCGTHLFYKLKEHNVYIVPVGLFDSNDDVIFDHQIFIEEKPPFYSFANETKNMTGAEVFAQYAGPSK